MQIQAKLQDFQNYYQHPLTSKNGNDESLIGLDLVGGTLFDGKEICNFAFTFQDVHDELEHLNSLGKAQTANVKRDAQVGVATANR